MSFNSNQWFLMGQRKVGAANTFVGGVSSVINTPTLLAAKLQHYPSGTAFTSANIQNFTIVGSDIECYIGVDYQIIGSAFRETHITASSPTYFRNYGKCKYISNDAFYVSYKTGLHYFPTVLSIGSGMFYHQNNIDADVVDKVMYFPNCTNIGSPTVADTTMFGLTSITQKYYANTFLQTNNAGGVDATLADGIANRGLVVVWVLNQTAPSAITNLTIGTITATTLQLNFTAPSSLNTIDFYEVWLNGKRTDKTVTASGQNITGLTTATLYNVQLKVVDIYYNKSELSNTATATTL